MEAQSLVVVVIIVFLAVLCTSIGVSDFRQVIFSDKQLSQVSEFSEFLTPMVAIFLSWLPFVFIPDGTVLSGGLLLLTIISGACLMINFVFFALAFRCG